MATQFSCYKPTPYEHRIYSVGLQRIGRAVSTPTVIHTSLYGARDLFRYTVEICPHYDRAWLTLATLEHTIGQANGTSGYYEANQVLTEALSKLPEQYMFDVYHALSRLNTSYGFIGLGRLYQDLCSEIWPVDWITSEPETPVLIPLQFCPNRRP